MLPVNLFDVLFVVLTTLGILRFANFEDDWDFNTTNLLITIVAILWCLFWTVHLAVDSNIMIVPHP